MGEITGVKTGLKYYVRAEEISSFHEETVKGKTYTVVYMSLMASGKSSLYHVVEKPYELVDLILISKYA